MIVGKVLEVSPRESAVRRIQVKGDLISIRESNNGIFSLLLHRLTFYLLQRFSKSSTELTCINTRDRSQSTHSNIIHHSNTVKEQKLAAMAFKFVAILATLATVSAASLWNNNFNSHQSQRQQQQTVAVQQGPSDAVSTNWMWNENMDRQQQEDNQQMDLQQRQWNEQRNSNWNRYMAENSDNRRNWDNNQRMWNDQRNWDNQRSLDNKQWNWNRDWDRSGHQSEGNYDSHPRYEYGYEVRDRYSGDFKSHRESRDGDVVRGQYSMVESDGSRRIVDYTSDGENGFNANVRKEGWSRHD